MAFDKKLYWERRRKNLRGIPGAVTVHSVVIDDNDKEQRIPVGNKVGHNRGLGLREQHRVRGSDSGFTKKGFKGHALNEPRKVRGYQPDLTNHVRHTMRAEAKSASIKEAKVNKNHANPNIPNDKPSRPSTQKPDQSPAP